MMRLTGEQKADYFHLICEGCRKHVEVLKLGWDNGVQKIEFECKTCEDRASLKLTTEWLDAAEGAFVR